MFRVELNNIVHIEMIDIVGEITEKQERGKRIFPLKSQKNLEIIYDDGWVYHYDGYKRPKNKKGCQIQPSTPKEEEEEVDSEEDKESNENNDDASSEDDDREEGMKEKKASKPKKAKKPKKLW